MNSTFCCRISSFILILIHTSWETCTAPTLRKQGDKPSHKLHQSIVEFHILCWNTLWAQELGTQFHACSYVSWSSAWKTLDRSDVNEEKRKKQTEAEITWHHRKGVCLCVSILKSIGVLECVELIQPQFPNSWDDVLNVNISRNCFEATEVVFWHYMNESESNWNLTTPYPIHNSICKTQQMFKMRKAYHVKKNNGSATCPQKAGTGTSLPLCIIHCSFNNSP